MTEAPPGQNWEFDGFTMLTELRLLLSHGIAVPLTPKAFDTLATDGTDQRPRVVPGGVNGGGPEIGATEVIGVAVAALVLVVTFGSLVAAGMTLLTALVGVVAGMCGLLLVTAVVDVSSSAPVLALMLGLAVGIDYALFIFTRFRQELTRGREVGDAVGTAVGTAGSAVLTAGITVVIALAGLVVAGIPFLTEMGLAAAATVVVAVLLALTLVPAVLGFVGRRMLRRRPRRERGFWAGWARIVTTRRWLSLVAAVVALGVLAIPVASMRTTLVQPDAAGTTQARATQILSERATPKRLAELEADGRWYDDALWQQLRDAFVSLTAGVAEAKALRARRQAGGRELTGRHLEQLSRTLEAAEATLTELRSLAQAPPAGPPQAKAAAADGVRLRLELARRRLQRAGVLERPA